MYPYYIYMCINSTVSIVTWTTSTILSLYLIYRNNYNDRYIGIVILGYALMQLIEYFMWKNQNNKFGNIISTKLAFILLWLQPFIITFALLFFNNYFTNTIYIYILYLFTFIYFIGFIYSIYNTFTYKNNNFWISKPGKNCHLIWGFMKYNKLLLSIVYLSSFFFILLSKPLKSSLVIFIILLFTYLYSKINYNKSQEYGTIWCWIANILPICIIFINYK